MEASPQEQIASIVSQLEARGVPAAPVVESLALATSRPEAVYNLTTSVMRRFPKGGTFLDAALSDLPETLWPRLVERAVEALEPSVAAFAKRSGNRYSSLEDFNRKTWVRPSFRFGPLESMCAAA